MRIDRGSDALALARGGVVTIGNYDGLHRGQRAVVERIVRRARELDAPAVVVTFDPHPLAVLDPGRVPRRIATDRQRERALADAGVTHLWILPFTPELSRVSAADFVREYLVGRIGARELVVGSRFAFGRGREGTLELLERLGREAGFRATGLPEVLHAGEPVSSTRIRRALGAGDVELATELLGRPFALAGTIVEGEKLGRQIGWPTANLVPENEILPAHGVYASRLRTDDGEWRNGVTNIGVRPTRASDGGPHVETHLFDFNGDLYGRPTELELHRRLREERRFPSLEALAAQIAADAASAREYFLAFGRSQDQPDPGPRQTAAPQASHGKDESHGE